MCPRKYVHQRLHQLPNTSNLQFWETCYNKLNESYDTTIAHIIFLEYVALNSGLNEVNMTYINRL